MSDDELPPATMDNMGGMDGSSDDEGMGDYDSPPDLPDGVKKEFITPAPEGNWKKPKTGDEVTVHYVGTLEADGSEFDSSRSRGKPFVFTLGKGQVIKGWDLGVATMKKGEVAKFTLEPEFAYGDAGSPPKIPEKATLVFEVELISWTSKDDLFGDEGVIKSQLQEGSGWKSPKEGDEILLTMKVMASDESVIEERTDFELTMGSGALGSLEKACEKALMGMKKGEVAELKCSKDYAYGDERPDGCTVSLTLKEIYETKDVSFAKNKSVMKKQILEGESWETPKDTAKVKLVVEAILKDSSPLPGFESKALEFTAGNGEVCDALECAVGEMKKGERAVLTVTDPSLISEPKLGLEGGSFGSVVLTLLLEEFEKAKDTWTFSEEEKLEFGAARKEVGGDLFKKGRVALALQRYKKIGEMFSYVDNFKEDNKQKAKDLKKTCELNKAACYLKLKDYAEARTACDAVLKEDKSSVKATYRRAQAEFGLKNFPECIRDCKKTVELDPQNKDARALVKQAQAGQKEVDKQAKGLFANMCKALGKGPIPEPGRSKDVDDMEEDEEEEEEEEEGEEDVPMGGEDASKDSKEDAGEAAAAETKAEAA